MFYQFAANTELLLFPDASLISVFMILQHCSNKKKKQGVIQTVKLTFIGYSWCSCWSLVAAGRNRARVRSLLIFGNLMDLCHSTYVRCFACHGRISTSTHNNGCIPVFWFGLLRCVWRLRRWVVFLVISHSTIGSAVFSWSLLCHPIIR